MKLKELARFLIGKKNIMKRPECQNKHLLCLAPLSHLSRGFLLSANSALLYKSNLSSVFRHFLYRLKESPRA